MPVKANAQAKPKNKTQVKTKAGAQDKTSDEKKEANRLRQQRFLEKHRDEINEQRRQRYADRKEAGQCPRCGKKLRSRKSTLCKDCLERAKAYNQQ